MSTTSAAAVRAFAAAAGFRLRTSSKGPLELESESSELDSDDSDDDDSDDDDDDEEETDDDEPSSKPPTDPRDRSRKCGLVCGGRTCERECCGVPRTKTVGRPVAGEHRKNEDFEQLDRCTCSEVQWYSSVETTTNDPTTKRATNNDHENIVDAETIQTIEV